MSGAAATSGFVHLFLPRGESGPRTSLLLLHGTGGDEQDLVPIGRALLPGAALLSPRGKVLENGMPRFFRRLSEGVFDVEDLHFRTHELADFVQAAARTYGLDPKRLVAVGYSNGANIAASMLLLRPETLAGAVLFRPMLPFEPDQLPDLSGKAVLISSGQADPIVPASHPEALSRTLTLAGASVDLKWNRGGHALGDEDIEAAREWLAMISQS